MTSEFYRQSHLERNIALIVTAVFVTVVLGAIYVAPDMAERSQERKEWRENASCGELSDYLIVNVDDHEYRNYELIQKIWEIKCKQN